MIKTFLTALLLCLTAAAVAAPKAELWAHWQAHTPGSAETVDHSLWDELLSAYVAEGSGDKAGIALFNYAAVTAADAQRLDEYLQQLAQTDVAALSRDEQRAYWINLYNALTVDVILAHYPVESIRDIGGGLFSPGPWGEKRFQADGQELSLDDIEHRILRPIWQDARIHYAVNCASIGCPNLAARAYTAENTEALLDAGAAAYVNHPRGARAENGALIVSSIYQWFQEDFGGDDAGVIRHLRQYADDNTKALLDGVSAIGGDEYDWALNAQ